jgi:hypothetical protein
VFLGQLTVMFQWIAGNFGIDNDQRIVIPKWAIQVPPAMAIGLFLVASITIIIGNANGGHAWAISPDVFKNVVTFSVSLLNASTVFLVTRLFPLPRDASQPSVPTPPTGQFINTPSSHL